MEVPILIELVGDVYRAWSRNPVIAEATAFSSHEARDLLEAKLRDALGCEVETYPFSANEPGKTWLAFAGTLPNDELTQEWLDAIAESRRVQDAEDLLPRSAPISAIDLPRPTGAQP